MNPLLATDSYKLGHHLMYPKGTTLVYSNFTPRSNKHAPEGIDEVVSFGQQMVVKKIHEMFDEHFFSKPKDEVVRELKREFSAHLFSDYDTFHIEALHDLGYLPIHIKAIEEGSLVPMGIPVLTIKNTHPEFYWITNYLETLLSNLMWKPITSATIAKRYKDLLVKWAEKTDKDNVGFVDFQGHDFSMRGLDSIDATISSGLGHAASFKGSDSLPTIHGARKYYNEKGDVVHSVNATEHSVMSAGTKDDEIGTFRHLLSQFPTGILSVVSDTWDLWKVITEYLPLLKDEIMSRDGKCVVRPDCYSDDTSVLTNNGWKLFTDLNPHVDLVAQVLDNGTYTFVKPLKYVNEYYEGEMISYKDHYGKIDLLVTPNHRMIYDNGSGNFREQEAKNCGFYHGKNIRRSALANNNGLQLSPIESLKIAFQADGSYTTSGNKIRFSFSKQRKIERLEGILKDCNYEYKIYSLKDGRFEFNINADASLFTKNFSWVNFESLCSNWCQEFIEELSYWDATRRHDKRFKFDTTNKSVVDVVELIAISAGYGVLVKKREDNRKDIFSDVFTAHIMLNNTLGGQSIKKEVTNYKGGIVCVQVPSGRLMVKRNGGQVVCGNSGNPVDIICGYLNISDGGIQKFRKVYPKSPYFDSEITELPEWKGVIELLWEIFGGTVNEQGYKVLDPHIGAIYGDSITIDRAEEICKRLEEKGFASTNIVLGIGSFTYQFNTRDTFGFAMKATYCEVNGEPREIFKDPVTDSGEKKSAKGLLRVVKEQGKYVLEQSVSPEKELTGELRTIYKDGIFYSKTTLTKIREKLAR